MIRAIASITLILASLGSQAALLGRAPATSGGTDYQAYYDDVQNITWLADANYSQTSGYDADGRMLWSTAQAWVTSLNTANHLGTNNWRLPRITDTNTPGCEDQQAPSGTDCGWNVDIATSEMAHLYYSTLGNVAFNDANLHPNSCDPNPPYCLTNSGPFVNIETVDMYWSGTEYAPNSIQAWDFLFNAGYQNYNDKLNGFYAWAVSSGDNAVSVVPIPAAIWLLGSALGVMGWAKRRAAG